MLVVFLIRKHQTSVIRQLSDGIPARDIVALLFVVNTSILEVDICGVSMLLIGYFTRNIRNGNSVIKAHNGPPY